MKSKSLNIWGIIICLNVAWSFFMLIATRHQANQMKSATSQNALIQAKTALAKDLLYRQWNAMQGGVYVESTEKTPPNPYLNSKEKNIVTTGGRQLTLINPAYMTQMVYELEKEEHKVVGHLTSLNPINPENAPDEWERLALHSFTGEDDIYSSFEEINNGEYLRYMRPFIVSESCLQCHGDQGYELGDIRGGISISVPMDSLRAVERKSITNDFLIHSFFWIIGLMGLVSAGRHISGQQSIQEQAEKEKEILQVKLLHAQKLESVGQLAAGIAHEINTPIQFVDSNLDFIEQTEQDLSDFMVRIQEIAENGPQEITDAMNKALEEADWEYLSEELPLAISQSREGIKRISTIVRAMKEFSHPTSKKMERQDLNKIINTTTTVATNEWKYVADMQLDLDQNLPEIPLLANEMGQVVLNILVNASHAIGEKFGDNSEENKGTISITTRKVGDAVELRISDTGMGISAESQLRIFDPFYTTKEVGKGTGQGLAISHDVIVNKHGGTIHVKSEESKGTSFIITLPLHTSTSEQK